MNKIVSLLLGLGVVGIVTGGVAGAGVIFLAPLAGVTGTSVTAAAYLAAAGFLGLMLDAKYGVSSKVQEDIWTREIDDARRSFEQGKLGYVGALTKVINAEFELSQPAIYLFRQSAGNQTAKRNREDKLWVVEKVLPEVIRDLGLYKGAPLPYWEFVVQELVDCLRQIRPEEGAIKHASRWLSTKLFGDKSGMAQKVAALYLELRNVKSQATIATEAEEQRLLAETPESPATVQHQGRGQARKDMNRS